MAAALGQSAELDTGGPLRSRGTEGRPDSIQESSAVPTRFGKLSSLAAAAALPGAQRCGHFQVPRIAARRRPRASGSLPGGGVQTPRPSVWQRSEPTKAELRLPVRGRVAETSERRARRCMQWRWRRRRRRWQRTSGGLYWGVRRTGAGAERSGGRVEGEVKPGRNGAGDSKRAPGELRGSNCKAPGLGNHKPHSPSLQPGLIRGG